MWQKCKQILLTPVGVRVPKGPKQRLQGVALLMVMMSLALMAAIVGDFSYNEMVRYKLAIHERDAAKAEALARSGLEMARLLLIVQGSIQQQLEQLTKGPMLPAGFSLPAFTVWELIPLDSDKIQGMAAGDLAGLVGVDISDSLAKRKKKLEELKKAKPGSFTPPLGGFGNFDGSFKVTITDEESKISIRDWAAADQKQRYATFRMLLALFAPERYNRLFEDSDLNKVAVNRHQLAANIYDYMDLNDLITDPLASENEFGVRASGSEKSLYASDDKIEPKNAAFDSLEELILVHGMTDRHMLAFADALTIYGKPGSVNILTAKDQVMEAVTRYCATDMADQKLSSQAWMDELIKKWRYYQKNNQGPNTPQGFSTFLQAQGLLIDSERCTNALSTHSENFTVKSEATVGDVTKTVTMVIRVDRNVEELNYFRIH